MDLTFVMCATAFFLSATSLQSEEPSWSAMTLQSHGLYIQQTYSHAFALAQHVYKTRSEHTQTCVSFVLAPLLRPLPAPLGHASAMCHSAAQGPKAIHPSQ